MRIAPALTIACLLAVPAAAQNDSVTVGGTGDGQALIDPATGQTRYVPELLQPWQDQIIRLRRPGHHRVHKTATATSAAPVSTAAASPTTSDTETTPPPPKKLRHTAAATPTETPPAPPPAPKRAPAAPAKQSLSGFGDIDLITGTGQQALAQQAAPKAVAKAAPLPKPAPVVEAKPQRTASLEKPKARTPSGNRKDSITFAANASDPSTAAVSAVRTLAASLSSSMGDSGRVQLMAYAGAKGEKSSDTRRLTHKSALVIRQLKIDDGIPAERIEVFALGGSDDDGPLDRVDVFLKS